MVVKLNVADKFPEMFQKEAAGLKLLKNSGSFRIPEVFGFGEISNHAYLLLEYLPNGKKGHGFWLDFAEKLVELHKNTSETFGLDHDNYIGSLPQYNKTKIQNSTEFYYEKRLKPQLDLAAKNGYNFKDLDKFYGNLRNNIPDENPSLVHGDLWNGNYMVTDNSEAVLIDPAVAFAPREMDIAMMQLFGGFPSEVFSHYHAIFPMENGWEERIEIWQLYYLLIHLNLFGRGYFSSIERIIKRYK